MKKNIPFLLLLLFLFGCASQSADINTEENTADGVMEGSILIETNKGRFTIQLYEDTPNTKQNFLSLVQSGFYTGLTFHRYEPGFVIQGGDPNGDGTGGSEETIELEIANGKSHTRGTIGMARSSDPNSASSQFFVNLADNTFLDGSYAVFGEVTEGMDVVDILRVGDTITKMTVTS